MEDQRKDGAEDRFEALRSVPQRYLDAYRGRRVTIPAPSYQFLNRDGTIDHGRRERSLEGLVRLGVIPTLMAGALTAEGRFAGSDERRAADFQTALVRPETDLVMALRGGYGMTRVLPLLDWEAIGRATTPAVGFSDFTAFNLALLARTGRASWHGAMAGAFERPDAWTVERFSAVFGADPGPLVWEAEPELFGNASGRPERLAGTIWGGNLCLIASLTGSPWMPRPEQTDGGLLFLEDVGECAYRVERMLLTLLEAGILERQRAVILGDFANADDSVRFEGDQTLAQVVAYLRRRLPAHIPVVTGLPFGHIDRKAVLPVGVPGELELTGRTARLVWSETP